MTARCFIFCPRPKTAPPCIRAGLRAVKPGGDVVVATFAEDGPTQCRGLPVIRYSADELRAEFGELFSLVSHDTEAHQTPFGTVQ